MAKIAGSACPSFPFPFGHGRLAWIDGPGPHADDERRGKRDDDDGNCVDRFHGFTLSAGNSAN